MMTLEDYERLVEKMEAETTSYDEPAGQAIQERPDKAQEQFYEGSAEGEYHYAAIEEQD
jgi:hypothetical protein